MWDFVEFTQIFDAPISSKGKERRTPVGLAPTPHTGKLSCFLPGISTVFPHSIASARAMRGRVACGMITSPIVPRSAAQSSQPIFSIRHLSSRRLVETSELLSQQSA